MDDPSFEVLIHFRDERQVSLQIKAVSFHKDYYKTLFKGRITIGELVARKGAFFSIDQAMKVERQSFFSLKLAKMERSAFTGNFKVEVVKGLKDSQIQFSKTAFLQMIDQKQETLAR